MRTLGRGIDMIENISTSFQSIWSHKLRSLLTMLGIIIGIASIITIVSTIRGTNEQIKENIVGSGNNVVTVRLTQSGADYEFDYEGMPKGVTTVSEDVKKEIEKVPGVTGFALYHERSYTDNIFYKNVAFSGAMYGVDDSYLKLNDYHIIAGRGFSESDHNNFKKVAVVDSDTALKLFEGDNPVGKTLEIRGEPFVVIGIADKQNTKAPVINSLYEYEMYADSSSGEIFIPINSWQIVYAYDEPESVAVKASSTDKMTSVGKDVADVLNANVSSDAKVKYEAENLLEQAANMQTIANSARSQLIWIAGISLLVGGIGVMNIMMVSVTERTKEIGLKKAIGARRGTILRQFLTEASVLCGIGGLLGVAAGIGLAALLSAVMDMPTAISIPACIISVVFSTLIGLIFGLMPAIKASKLNPIEALNRE